MNLIFLIIQLAYNYAIIGEWTQMRNCDIVIIDSGVDLNVAEGISGICISKLDNDFVYTENIADTVGHGTIIYSVIRKQTSTSDIFVIKLSESLNGFDASMLIEALNYVKNNIQCKIINISMGMKMCECLSELYNICFEISNRGILIISAFDNEGCISYPAAFDCVIGVDSKKDFKSILEIDYVENSPINVFAKGSLQRLKIKNGRNLLIGGSSIACAHIVSILANELDRDIDMKSALACLKKKSRNVYLPKKADGTLNAKMFKINNALVFPFSKEAHAFVRFNDMLTFAIKGYYDVRRSGKVGRKLSSYYEGVSTNETIMDIEKIDFKGIDTIILGHLEELNSVSERDYREELIHKAIEKKINIYSFDPLEQYSKILASSDIKYFTPYISSADVSNNSFGKLYQISKPVVGIFGTSSQQGKFSLQLALKRELEKREYNVGAIGTEPHSILFGLDVVFPMGYNSTVYLQNQEVVLYLNKAVNDLCLMGKEIILASSQAQTIPFYCNNLLEFPLLQYHFALGIRPDAIILCINCFDEIEYIQNTVYMLKGLTDATIIAFVMNPMTLSNEWSNLKRKITYEEFSQKVEILQDIFGIPVFLLGEESVNELCQTIVDFF